MRSQFRAHSFAMFHPDCMSICLFKKCQFIVGSKACGGKVTTCAFTSSKVLLVWRYHTVVPLAFFDTWLAFFDSWLVFLDSWIVFFDSWTTFFNSWIAWASHESKKASHESKKSSHEFCVSTAIGSHFILHSTVLKLSTQERLTLPFALTKNITKVILYSRYWRLESFFTFFFGDKRRSNQLQRRPKRPSFRILHPLKNNRDRTTETTGSEKRTCDNPICCCPAQGRKEYRRREALTLTKP